MQANRWWKSGRRVAPLVLVLVLLATLIATPMARAQDPATGLELGELELIWEAGGPAPNTLGTMTMATHPITGDLWVAVAHDDQYWIMSPDGEYRETWGETGSGPGQFRFDDPSQMDPWASGAIAFAPDGSFYVGDLGNYRVQRFDAERAYVGEWGSFGKGDGQFSQLLSTSTDGETVFVGDCDRWDIQAFDMEGTFLRSFDGGMGFCDPAALDADGALHVTNTENDKGAPFRYGVLDQQGEVLRSVDLSGVAPDAYPWAVAVAPDGTAYVSMIRFADGRDEHVAIVEIDPGGQVVRGWQGGGDRLLLSPDGDALYVARGVSLPQVERWSFIRKYALPPVAGS